MLDDVGAGLQQHIDGAALERLLQRTAAGEWNVQHLGPGGPAESLEREVLDRAVAGGARHQLLAVGETTSSRSVYTLSFAAAQMTIGYWTTMASGGDRAAHRTPSAPGCGG